MGKRPRGAMTIYRGKKSKRLGSRIMRELKPLTDYKDIGNRRDVRGLAVLRGSKTPAVIVETLSLSSPAERKVLKSESGRREIAEAIVRGVAEFENVKYIEPAKPKPKKEPKPEDKPKPESEPTDTPAPSDGATGTTAEKPAEGAASAPESVTSTPSGVATGALDATALAWPTNTTAESPVPLIPSVTAVGAVPSTAAASAMELLREAPRPAADAPAESPKAAEASEIPSVVPAEAKPVEPKAEGAEGGLFRRLVRLFAS
jgi:hypothetical protein